MRTKRGLGYVQRPGKRPRVELTIDYAKSARTDIDGISLQDLSDPTKSTRLPYTGLVKPDSMPGMEIEFWGSFEVAELHAECLLMLKENGPAFIQWVGPKGFGKSCILRALACVLYPTLPGNIKLLCIWHMEGAQTGVVEWIKGALLFAYIRDEKELTCIQELKTLEELKDFMHVQETMGEEFVFIVDGAQKIDVWKWHEGSRAYGDPEARRDLNSVLVGRKVVWGLTPLAEKLHKQIEDPMDMGIVCYMEGCPEAVQKLKDRLITHVVEAPEKLNGDPLETATRKRDVEEYCGNHFLSAMCFEAASLQVAANRHGRVKFEDVPELLADKQVWAQVIWEFVKQHHIKSIGRSLERNFKLKEPCAEVSDITRIDPRYALDWHSRKQTRFCTAYIHRVYLEIVRKAEATLLKTEVYHSWVTYCQSLLAEPKTNWKEMGWLCERVACTVIAGAGVMISQKLQISGLATEMFYTIPNLREQARHLGADSGVCYFPWRWNFARVETVVLYKDTGKKLHLVGVQFTTNKNRHQHSEDEFMSVMDVGQWYPDIVTAVEREELMLHFAFICLDAEESKYKEALKLLKKKRVLQHWLHVTRFDDSLKGRVSPEVISCLRKMAERRELDCADLPVAQPFRLLSKCAEVIDQLRDYEARYDRRTEHHS